MPIRRNKIETTTEQKAAEKAMRQLAAEGKREEYDLAVAEFNATAHPSLHKVCYDALPSFCKPAGKIG